MATHSSVLAWRFPGMAGPGGLPSMGSHRVGHDRSDLAAAAAHFMIDQYKISHAFWASYSLGLQVLYPLPPPQGVIHSG